MTLKSQSSGLFEAYLDFDRFRPNESLISYESSLSDAYHKYTLSLSLSQEGINRNELISSFIGKAIDFITHIINAVINLVLNVINFFKKLIISAMDASMMRNYSEFYETHRATILANFNKYASTTYVTAIPPKSINSFNSDNKIVLSVQQTLNLLEEIDRSFKQRVDLWEARNKRKDSDSNSIFTQLFERLDTIKTHITDSVLLGSLGIRIEYNIKPLSLYDPQVKDFLIKIVNERVSGSSGITSVLGIIFSMPKMVINTFLFGKPEIKPDIISITNFLQMTGPKEFDKLTYNNMSSIKSNILIIEGLAKKMDAVSKRIEISGNKFCDSLKRDTPALMNLTLGGEDNTRQIIDIAQKLIMPLLPIVNSFFSYFSSLIINYSMYYCRHRKSLYEAAKMLILKENNEESIN
jgi:hypothetical protein